MTTIGQSDWQNPSNMYEKKQTSRSFLKPKNSTQDKTVINPIDPNRYTSTDPKQAREVGGKRPNTVKAKKASGSERKSSFPRQPQQTSGDKEETKGEKWKKKGEKNRRP